MQTTLFPDPLAIAFAEFDAANPRVWELFCRFTERAIAAGHKRYSADAIVHLIRWHTTVETTGKAYKIRNAHVAFYARKWRSENPGRADFFRIVPRKGEA